MKKTMILLSIGAVMATCSFAENMINVPTKTETQKLSKEKEKIELFKEKGIKTEIETGLSATDLLKKAYTFIGKMREYGLEATIINEDALGGGMMIHIRNKYDVKVSKPGKVRMDISGDTENKTLVFNEGKATVIGKGKHKTYGTINVSKDIDDAIEEIKKKYGFKVPLTQFIYDHMADEPISSKKGYYLGTVNTGGTECYYIAIPGEEVDIQFWIQKNGAPLIRKVFYLDKKTKGQPRSMVSLKWDIERTTPIDKKIFNVVIPKDAKKAEILTIEESKKIKARMRKTK